MSYLLKGRARLIVFFSSGLSIGPRLPDAALRLNPISATLSNP